MKKILKPAHVRHLSCLNIPSQFDRHLSLQGLLQLLSQVKLLQAESQSLRGLVAG